MKNMYKLLFFYFFFFQKTQSNVGINVSVLIKLGIAKLKAYF